MTTNTHKEKQVLCANSPIPFNQDTNLKKIVRTDVRVDRSWDKAAAARGQQHIHLAGKKTNLQSN